MLIYNTMTRRKEELTPIKQGEISMYVCGRRFTISYTLETPDR